MKIKPNHLEHLKKEIAKVLDRYPSLVDEYETGKFARADKVKDLQRRFCFDLSFGAGLNEFICKELYPYMNDDHLYTALKAVCPKITKRY